MASRSDDAPKPELLEGFSLNPDRPITRPADDLLRREPFAQALAAQIRAAPREGLVMAVTGPWGSGKTSLLNLIESALSEGTSSLRSASTPGSSRGQSNWPQDSSMNLARRLRRDGLNACARSASTCVAIRDFCSRFVSSLWQVRSSRLQGNSQRPWVMPSMRSPVTRTLDSHASRLRRKLAAAGGDFVRNVWGVGYSLLNESTKAPRT
jgi:energy-coupling factor transporter ATP-binding protein EcfA2